MRLYKSLEALFERWPTVARSESLLRLNMQSQFFKFFKGGFFINAALPLPALRAGSPGGGLGGLLPSGGKQRQTRLRLVFEKLRASSLPLFFCLCPGLARAALLPLPFPPTSPAPRDPTRHSRLGRALFSLLSFFSSSILFFKRASRPLPAVPAGGVPGLEG